MNKTLDQLFAMYDRNLAQLMLVTKRDRDSQAWTYIYFLLYKQSGKQKMVSDLAKFL